MNVADASVWVSALVPADEHHAASRAWLELQDAGDHWIVAPALLLPEVAAAVSRRTQRPALARRALTSLSSLPILRIVPIDAELAVEAARLAADRALRGADAIYVAVARRLSIPLITWDREQTERGGAVAEVSRPPHPAP